MSEEAGPEEWADRFRHQAGACRMLGSDAYARLLGLVADDVGRRGRTWDLVSQRSGLRFGQAGPLRLVGAAHRLALSGQDPRWASLMPSCGGALPGDDQVLADEWDALVSRRPEELLAGLDREVQTNEVGRAAGLALGLASARLPDGVELVEIGSSGGLNLRLDRFRIEVGVVLGDPAGRVRLAPEVRSALDGAPALPTVAARTGLDPHPVDPAEPEGRLTLLSFVWPDQVERFERVRAAIEEAERTDADVRSTTDTSGALREVLGSRRGPAAVQHSIVWQYLPVRERSAVTAVIEEAGARATERSPLAWVRFEPDEWDRDRAAVWVRRWPGGADRLVAHADYHGRWLAPVPTS